MSKEAEYRELAAKRIGLASRASSNRDKSRLLEMTEKWLDLAERARRLARRFKPHQWQHPLLRIRLGDEKHPDAD